jgi:hypothetical protein
VLEVAEFAEQEVLGNARQHHFATQPARPHGRRATSGAGPLQHLLVGREALADALLLLWADA